MNHGILKHERPPTIGAPAPMSDADRSARLRRALGFAYLCGVGAAPTTTRKPSLSTQSAPPRQPSAAARQDALEAQRETAMLVNTALLEQGLRTNRIALAVACAFGSPSAEDLIDLFDA